MQIEIIDLTPETIADYGVCGYKDVKKHLELRNKIDWFAEYYPKGLRIKVLLAQPGGYQGMIEYLPGAYAHRPVAAERYMFIQCLFVGFKNEFKGNGYGSSLIAACLDDAKAQDMAGVAVVARKGSFMADNRIFLKSGFRIIDSSKPDFDLLVNQFDERVPAPHFKKAEMQESLKQYSDGLTIIRSVQCPYTEKNVNAIVKTAQSQFHLDPKVVDLNDAASAQTSPSPFGSFCIIYNGEIISHHPISNKRFENIMHSVRNPGGK